jgi:parallel beta-helix repeat protein
MNRQIKGTSALVSVFLTLILFVMAGGLTAAALGPKHLSSLSAHWFGISSRLPQTLDYTAPTTIVVTSNADSGPGTLREALLGAGTGDTITFDPAIFPPNAPVTIMLNSTLPIISQGRLTLDASNAGVILDGSELPTESGAVGLVINSDENIVRGLQIIDFPTDGIDIGGKNNTIGGDRGVGNGPLGQGNLLSGNGERGIVLWGEGTSLNTIVGNYIGTDSSGISALGNGMNGVHMNGGSHNQVVGNLISGNHSHGIDICGQGVEHNTFSGNYIGTDVSGAIALGNLASGIVFHCGASHNVAGADNIIAFNQGHGVEIQDPGSLGNTITRNSIHDNGGLGIDLRDSGNTELAAPLLTDFDLGAGTLVGTACANCTVEIFSTSSDEGESYEGQTVADGSGIFAFNKGTAFTNPHLTATSTDTSGNTSEFSEPTSGAVGSLILQVGNRLPKTRLLHKPSRDLERNRIGEPVVLDVDSEEGAAWVTDHASELGLKWMRVSLDWWDWDQVESTGDFSEHYINPYQDQAVTDLANNGFTIVYTLLYWDESLLQLQEGDSRFRTEDEIQPYLDYVEFLVHNFKDRIEYYQIWNEPDVAYVGPEPVPQQYVEIADYINLVERVIPVIRQEYPQAKIVVGNVSGLRYSTASDYLFAVVSSDIMPFVDGVSWHPMYGDSPEYDPDYYYAYPSLVQEIKDVSSAHGFGGEYIAEEMTWRTSQSSYPHEPEYTETVAAKYYARGIVMHLGMGTWAGVGGEGYPGILPVAKAIRNLSTVMAGTELASIPVQIQSEATNVVSYTFALSGGGHLLALWTDGVAVDDDPGTEATLVLDGFSDHNVMGFDVIHGFKQQLITDAEGEELIIPNLLVKDYPLLLRLTSTKYIFLPVVLKGHDD